jgi:hypothetical protein
MSARIETPVLNSPEEVPDVKQRKPRAPTLAAKFAKFYHFVYHRINTLDVDAAEKSSLMTQFSVFAPVPDQVSFAEEFIVQQKSIAKEYKAELAKMKKAAVAAEKAANKPKRGKKAVQIDFQNELVNQLLSDATGTTDAPQAEEKPAAKKGRKPRAKKDAEPTDTIPEPVVEPVVEAAPEPEKKEKKPRAKKAAAPEPEPVVEPVVEAAPEPEKKEKKPRAKKAAPPEPEPVVEPVVEAAPEPEKKEKKPRAKKAAAPEPEPEPVVKAAPEPEKKEKKPRAKKADTETEKKPRAKKAAAPAKEEEEDEVETTVNNFVHEGKTYLRDSDNTLYDTVTHEQIGHFDAETNTIVAV